MIKILLFLFPFFLYADTIIKQTEYQYQSHFYLIILFLYLIFYPFYKRRIYIKQNINFYKILSKTYNKVSFYKEILKSFFLMILENIYNVIYFLGFIAVISIFSNNFINKNYFLSKQEEFINLLFVLSIILFVINFLIGFSYVIYRFIKNKKILKKRWI